MLFGSGNHRAACLLMGTALKGAEWRRGGCLQHFSMFTYCHTNNYVITGSSCGHANMPSQFSVAVFASLIAMENF